METKRKCKQCGIEIGLKEEFCSDACETIFNFNENITYSSINDIFKYESFYRKILNQIEEKNYKIKYHRKCNICGRDFIGSTSNSSWCGSCKIQFKCPDCGKWIDTLTKYIKERKGKITRCDTCSRKHNTIKWNKSEKCKEWKQSKEWSDHSSKIMNNWNSSEKGKEHNKKLLEQNHENWSKSEENINRLSAYSKTEEHREFARIHMLEINMNGLSLGILKEWSSMPIDKKNIRNRKMVIGKPKFSI